MGEWITLDDTACGVPTAISLAQVSVIYFEHQDDDVHALVRCGTSDAHDDNPGETWFRITQREGVEALRRYVNARRLKGFAPV